MLQRHGGGVQRRRTAEPAGRAQAMQAVAQACGVVVQPQALQFARQFIQFPREQAAQGRHHRRIAGGGERSRLVEQRQGRGSGFFVRLPPRSIRMHHGVRTRHIAEVTPQQFAQRIQRDRFGDGIGESRGAQREHARRNQVGAGGDGDGVVRSRVRVLAQSLHHGFAAQFRHAQVEQQQVEMSPGGEQQRLRPVGGRFRIATAGAHGFGEEVQAHGVVVGDQDRGHGRRSLRALVSAGRLRQNGARMNKDQARRIARLAAAASLALCALPAQARVVRVRVQHLDVAGVRIEGLQLDLDAAAASAQLVAQLKPGVTGSGVKSRCLLMHAVEGWRCEGDATWTPGDAAAALNATFRAGVTADDYSLVLTRERTQLAVTAPRHSSGTARAVLRDLPLSWLQPALSRAWPDAKFGDGRLGVEASFDTAAKRDVSLTYTLRDAALDTRDGRIAVAGLAANGTLGFDARTPLRLHHAGTLNGGEVLCGGFYARLPQTPVTLAFELAAPAQGQPWQLDALRYVDSGTLSLDGMARIDTAADSPLVALELRRFDAVFPAAFDRYAKAWLSTTGFGELALRGRLGGSMRIDAEGLAAFALDATALDAGDGAGRFALGAIDGSLAWDRQHELPPTALAWKSGQAYRLTLGEARTQWISRGGDLALAAPAAMSLAGGTLEIPHLAVRPDAAKGERLRAGFAAHEVDLGTLSLALGWPKFSGKLGGAVPAIRYVGERIELDGGLFLQLFDGSVNITHLALERPFGVAPSLAADIALDKLDLQPLTAAFGFGEITGRLSGHIGALRTVDWAPVAFDAELHSDDGGKLSQRAVNNLTSVGGGGIAAGLQAGVLRLFDTFGYRRLALACRLSNNVCRMGGIDSSAAGYTIVEGRGLPHITVVGHQQEVDWPTLVARLKAATSGTAPIIR